jgi:hypothetical protein
MDDANLNKYNSIVSENYEVVLRNIFANQYSQSYRIWLRLINFLIILSCLALAASTHAQFATEFADTLGLIERISIIFFSIDYLGNIYFANNRLKYIFSFWGLIDLISILPTILQIINFSFLRSIKIVQAIRVIRILRILKLMRTLIESRNGLVAKNPILTNLKIYFTALFMVIVICSSLMYYVEGGLYSEEAMRLGQQELNALVTKHNQASTEKSNTTDEIAKFVPIDPVDGTPIAEDKRFYTSIPTTMWWCILAITGNSDMFPVTFWGRLIACFTFLAGLVLFGVLIIIVGETIIKQFFVEFEHQQTPMVSSRSTILALMTQRGWISQERLFEVEQMSEEEIKSRLKQL